MTSRELMSDSQPPVTQPPEVIDDRTIHLTQPRPKSDEGPAETYCGQHSSKSVTVEAVRWDNPHLCKECLGRYYARRDLDGRVPSGVFIDLTQSQS